MAAQIPVFGHGKGVTVQVIGTPGAQGSKIVSRTGHAHEADPKVRPWRQDVRDTLAGTLQGARAVKPGWPVKVSIVFYFPRPKGHYRTGKHAGQLKWAAPRRHYVKPDWDKIARSTCDAITESGALGDDCEISTGIVRKLYADGWPSGAVIVIEPDIDPGQYDEYSSPGGG